MNGLWSAAPLTLEDVAMAVLKASKLPSIGETMHTTRMQVRSWAERNGSDREWCVSESNAIASLMLACCRIKQV